MRLTVGGAEAVSEKISSPEDAQAVQAVCAGNTAVCTSATREQKKEQPPKLYDLTTLQREANRMFGYTAKQTLDYAQSLYEKKLLTYPRTDSRYLTSDMAETASCILHLAAKMPPFDGCADFIPDVGGPDFRSGCVRPSRHHPHNGDGKGGCGSPARGRTQSVPPGLLQAPVRGGGAPCI